MSRSFARCRLVLALLGLLSPAAAVRAQEPGPALSEQIYAAAKPKLLQIRTLLVSADRQTSLGSGFLVGADGLAVTNYHVVSQYALEPATYRLDYAAPDGSAGRLTLMAIDVAHDLAVVRLDHGEHAAMEFDARALDGSLPKGERLYAMGNPLELGFTIVDGTDNGLVEHSYTERIHFSGAINPGMSGGPAVTADGKVAGINVAKRLDGELVSFLVPPRFAQALVARAASGPPIGPEGWRAEIGRQLADAEAALYRSLADQPFKPASFGPYRAPESAADWFTCWASTNQGQLPSPRASIETTRCTSDTGLFVASDLTTGRITLQLSHYRSVDLNPFQFSTFLGQQNPFPWFGAWSPKWFTPQRCHQDFVAPDQAPPALPLRLVWCARAYRAFPELYDVGVVAVTQDRDREALIARLSLEGVAYDQAVAVTRRFVEGISWSK